MKLEHLALNVINPVAMAAWYVEHLGMRIVRQETEAPYTHFLADSTGKILLEIYNNPPDQVLPYAAMNALQLHIAFVSQNPEIDKDALIEAGATLVEELHLDDGSHLIMLRDPWGLALQLCKRAVSMLDS
jgi:catechol 2,3-dioxygenase-like lactoylglutathione lyase family enzyme